MCEVLILACAARSDPAARADGSLLVPAKAEGATVIEDGDGTMKILVGPSPLSPIALL